tara:strand:- start:316 stop:555 length:240 start_codon:yes stop_codon:yes gene_type:complete
LNISIFAIGLPPIGGIGDDPIGGGGVIFVVCGRDLKKLLKLPLLSTVVSKFTCGGCEGAGGVPILPPIGPLTMKNLQKN